MLDRIKLQMNAMLRCCKTPAYRRKKNPYTVQHTYDSVGSANRCRMSIKTSVRIASMRAIENHWTKSTDMVQASVYCVYAGHGVVRRDATYCCCCSVTVLWQSPRSPKIYLPATAALQMKFFPCKIGKHTEVTAVAVRAPEPKLREQESRAAHGAWLDKMSRLHTG